MRLASTNKIKGIILALDLRIKEKKTASAKELEACPEK